MGHRRRTGILSQGGNGLIACTSSLAPFAILTASALLVGGCVSQLRRAEDRQANQCAWLDKVGPTIRSDALRLAACRSAAFCVRCFLGDRVNRLNLHGVVVSLESAEGTVIRTIHPFPARMAPNTVAHWLRALPPGARALDPMCGSGVVVRQSALLGHRARGLDLDPLAVLMSRVWTRKGQHTELLEAASELLATAKRETRFSHHDLPWMPAALKHAPSSNTGSVSRNALRSLGLPPA